jgi:putative addiction module antidote
MLKLKVRSIGSSKGVILPKEALQRLNVGDGETLYLTEAPDGFRLTAHDPEFERQFEVYREIAKRRRNVFKALADK